jgi:hypothetical protein
MERDWRLCNCAFWAKLVQRSHGAIFMVAERVTCLVATVRAWLSGRPEIGVVSRDRDGGYSEATTKALPEAFRSLIAAT